MSATAHELARVHRLTVDDYHRMGEAGILRPELRTELIEGEIIEMPPIGHSHGGTVNFLSNLLKESVGSAAVLSVQNPVVLTDRSEPQPDIALLRSRTDYYRNAHPRPEDVLLVVEVADTTLRYDRDVKLPLYASAGIREAWLVDVEGRTLTTYRKPGTGGYGEVILLRELVKVTIPLSPKRVIDLSGLF